jgi:hypothetical protein
MANDPTISVLIAVVLNGVIVNVGSHRNIPAVIVIRAGVKTLGRMHPHPNGSKMQLSILVHYCAIWIASKVIVVNAKSWLAPWAFIKAAM